MPASHFDVKAMTGRPKFIVRHSTTSEKKAKPSTLWSHHFMLKATLKLKRDINISKYNKVNSFMKRTSTGYKSKKSRVFTKEDVSRFLTEAPDEDFLHIITSVFLIN
jgi:hypothetical protein